MKKARLVHALWKFVEDEELTGFTNDLRATGFDHPPVQHDPVRDKKSVISYQHVAIGIFIGIDPDASTAAEGTSPKVNFFGALVTLK